MLSWALNIPDFIGLSFARFLSTYMMMNSETRKLKCNFQRHSHVMPRFSSAATSFSGNAFRASKKTQNIYNVQPSRNSYVSVINLRKGTLV